MGFFRGLGRMVKPLVNVPKWMDAQQIATDANYIKDIAKDVFTPQPSTRTETFEQALKRLNLTKSDIDARYREFRRLALTFGLLFIAVLAYIGYLLSGLDPAVTWKAVALSVAVSLIALVQFFRFHFWMFQIRRKKLGCSFKDYFFKGFFR